MKQLILFVVIILFNSSINAQEVETDNKENSKMQGAEKVNAPLAINDEIKFKNETGNAIITITDEGNNAGSILLPSVGSVLTGTKLFNNGGNLFWGGTQLNGSNGASAINDLSDAKSDGSSVFLGNGAGANDDGTISRNTAVGINALYLNTTGYYNTASGYAALCLNETGNHNTANGYSALYNNTTGLSNTANGYLALFSNTTGYYNTANGNNALFSNTTGLSNTANGYYALYNNTTGNHNTANGNNALDKNTTGYSNTANGSYALYANTTGYENTASGYSALHVNETGYENTANGYYALFFNTTGKRNTANGKFALRANETGYENTANGNEALYNNNTGVRNTASGYQSLFTNTAGHYNTANGYKALYNATGSNNAAVGRQALYNNTSGSNNIGVGYDAQVPNATSSNQVRIGNSSITYAGIQKAWSITSDKIWKEQIRVLPYGLDMVMQLKPVDYLRKNSDTKTREMGFIAQDVEALLTKLDYNDQGFLTKDDKGHLNLRYNDFIALLTKAVQEQNVEFRMKNDELKESIEKQVVSIKYQDVRIKTLEEENENLRKVISENKGLRNEYYKSHT